MLIFLWVIASLISQRSRMKALGRYLSDDPELFLTTSKTVSGASVTYYCGAIMLLRYVVPCVMKLLCTTRGLTNTLLIRPLSITHRAVGEGRTRDLRLGKPTLCQLSYYRNCRCKCSENISNYHAPTVYFCYYSNILFHGKRNLFDHGFLELFLSRFTLSVIACWKCTLPSEK